MFNFGKRKLKLSFQVALLAGILGAVPWIGYQFITEAKQFLDAGQMMSQKQFGRSVANSFYDNADTLTLAPHANVALPKTYLSAPITLDGEPQDWQDQSYRQVSFPLRQRVKNFGFSIAMGERGGDMYGLINILDKDPDFDTGLMTSFDQRDHLRIEWVGASGAIEHVVLVPQRDGFVAVFRVDKNWRRDTVDRFQRVPIRAVTKDTPVGYLVEFKISTLDLNAAQEIRFFVYDGGTRSGVSSMGASVGFHRLNTSSSVANQRLDTLSKSVNHIALYDTNFQIRAQTQVAELTQTRDTSVSVWQRVKQVVDDTMLFVLRMSMSTHADELESQQQLLVSAVTGVVAQARWSSFNGGGFLATAVPVTAKGGKVIGIVLVKESTDQILKLQLKSLQNIVLFSVIGILAILAMVFFMFSRLAYRVRKLRIETGNMVNAEGRLVANKLVSQTDRDDSIGDLARSFSEVVGKLHEQQSFMATMPRTLSHEIKNPLNAISTSLENINDYPLDDEIKAYTHIAQRGLHKIESILSKLSSAANLEQALSNDELEPLDLNHFLTLYCQHQTSHASLMIDYQGIDNAAMVQAVDYRLEQALDKLLDNAKDFCKPGSPIVVRLSQDKFDWLIDVENQGELLDATNSEQLFRSMVTSRTQASAGGEGHFGLGLYVVHTIAKFHHGSAYAANLADSSGVCFTIRLPARLI